MTVRDKDRRVGMYVVRPGVPAFVGRDNPGSLDLEWKGPDGQSKTRRVIVVRPMRVELEP